MTELSKNEDWMNSKAVCDLSHIREDGKLRYKKEGNAFRYTKKNVQRLMEAMEK